MQLKCIQPSEKEPITLQEAKLFLRVDHEEEDQLIQMLISTAREYAETFQRKILGLSTWEGTFSTPSKKKKIPLWPLQEVISIKYGDEGGTWHALTLTEYKIDEENGSVFLKNWPKDVVEMIVTFRAGIPYEEIPLKTKQAMLLLIGTWYEYREGIVIGKKVSQVPFTVQALLAMDRRW